MTNFMTEYIANLKKIYYEHQDPEETHFKFGIRLLSVVGVWPVPSNVTTPSEYYPYVSLPYKIYTYVTRFLIFAMVVTMTSDMFTAEARHSLALLGDDLSLDSGMWLVLYKTIFWSTNQEKIVKIFKELERRYKASYRDDERVLKLRRSYYIDDFLLLVILSASCFLMWLSFVVQPIFYGEKTLMFRAVFPFDATTDMGYALATAYQGLNSMNGIADICFVEVIGVMVINQATLHIHIIKEKFVNLGMDKSKYKSNAEFQKDMRNIIGELVKDHQDVMDVIEMIHNVFKQMYMVQVSASAFMICFAAFEITLTLPTDKIYCLKFISYMGSSLFQLLFWCWTGNRTYCMSTQINEAIYTSNWIEMDIDTQKQLAFIMMRSQKPLEFTAYPLYTLNYESFIAILSGAYTYFTLLTTLLDI